MEEKVLLGSNSTDTPSDSDTDLAVTFADDSAEKEEQDVDGVNYTGRFSEDHNVGQWIRCAKYFRWTRTHCVLIWRNILFVSLVRDKHCPVLSLCPLYLYFLKFCNYSLYFLCKLFTSLN